MNIVSRLSRRGALKQGIGVVFLIAVVFVAVFSQYAFSADTTPPEITINEPQNTSYSTTTLIANISLNEDGSACYYSVNGGSNVSMSGVGSVKMMEQFAGYGHTCILKSDGNVDCYGGNPYGNAEDYTGGDAIGVAAGDFYTCVLKSNGNVDCYGENYYGNAEDYTGGDAIGVAAGGSHTCILKSNGNADCYGLNHKGQSENYTGGDARGVAAGQFHTCILKSDGNVDCYGDNNVGQAENYTGGDARGVAAGQYHTCVLKSNGDVDCYGNNPWGQAEDYTGGDAVGVAAGKDHTCVLKFNGNVDCYGHISEAMGIDYGQADNYTGGNAIGVAAGNYHTCVLKSDGNVDCYGNNDWGQADNYTGGDAIRSWQAYATEWTSLITAPQGSNRIVFSCSDIGGNWNFSEVSFSVNTTPADTTPPEITINEPQNTTYDSQGVKLNVTATDETDLDKMWYVLNGEFKYIVPGILNVIDAQEGDNTVIIYSNDTSGNTNQSTIVFSVDSTAPQQNVVSPTQDAVYNDSNVSIEQILSDANLGAFWYYNYTIDAVDNDCDGVDEDGDGLVDEGYYSGYPYVCGLGDVARWSYCQSGVECCTPGSPSGISETICDGRDNDFDFSVDEDYSGYPCRWNGTNYITSCTNGIEYCSSKAINYSKYYHPSISMDPKGTRTELNVNGSAIFSEGTHSLTIYVNDSSGRESSTSVSFSVNTTPADTTPPEITIHSPENTTYAVSNLLANISLSENASECFYNLNGGGDMAMDLEINTIDRETLFFENGEGVGYLDGHKNWTATGTTTCDYHAGEINCGSGLSGPYVNNLSFNFKVGRLKFDALTPPDPMMAMPSSAMISLLGTDGKYYGIYCRSEPLPLEEPEDPEGPPMPGDPIPGVDYNLCYAQVGVSSVSVMGGPSVVSTDQWKSLEVEFTGRNIVYRYNGEVFHIANAAPNLTQLQFDADIAYLDNINVTRSEADPTTHWTVDFTAQEGDNHILFSCNDTSDNWGTNNVSFRVETTPQDITPPDLTVYSPENISYNALGKIITYTASDDNLDKVWYTLNGGPITYITGYSNVYFTAAEGNNQLEVYANDTSGNQNHISVSFTVDTINPSLGLYSPEDTTYNTNNVPLEYLASDTNLDSVWYYYHIIDAGDNDCDAVDDDGDGEIDEGYEHYGCGIGACLAYSTCVYGFEECTPRDFGIDNNCDGVDDDCDYYEVDEDYISYQCTINGATHFTTCTNGNEYCGDYILSHSIGKEYTIMGYTYYNILPDFFVGSQNMLSGNTTFTVPNGNYELVIYSNDTAKRWNSTSVSFFVNTTPADTTPPEITINEPQNTSYTTTTLIANISLNEKGSICYYSLNGGSNVSMSGVGSVKIMELFAGRRHTCILKSSRNVECYGDNGNGQAESYTGGDAVGVAGGELHTCILKSNGNVDCYGFNMYGQSNNYTGGDAIGVATGGAHTCVLKSSGNVDCYGNNDYGQAEDYTSGDAIGVAAGNYHTCVLKSSGNVDCYGNNDYGQAEDYTSGDAIGVATGGPHTCVLKSNGNVDCYGENADGQAEDYTGGDAIGVAAGNYHTCILKSNGNVDCYGNNDYGQAEDYIGGDANEVATGNYHTCILKSNRDVDCYGYNDDGQAGDYTGGDAIGVAAGMHTCILKSNGNVDCYGYNSDGQAEDYTSGDAIRSWQVYATEWTAHFTAQEGSNTLVVSCNDIYDNWNSTALTFTVEINNPPTPTPYFVNAPVFEDEDLIANGGYEDADNDPESGSSYKWYVNGILVDSGTTSGGDISLSSSHYNAGDTVIFSYNAYDGEKWSGFVNSTPITILYYSDSDLTVVNIGLSKSIINLGETVYINATIQNIGSNESTPTTVWLYDDMFEGPTTIISSVALPPLQPGESMVLPNAPYNPDQSGERLILASIEPANEHVFENNNMTRFLAAGWDITGNIILNTNVQSTAYRGDRIYILGTAEYNTTLGSGAPVEGSPVTVGLWNSVATARTDSTGAFSTVITVPSDIPNGTNTLYSTVTDFTLVGEDTDTITILERPGPIEPIHGPDLTLSTSDIYSNPNNPLTTDNATLYARIRNLGDRDAYDASVTIYDNGQPLLSTNIPYIPASGSVLISTGWTGMNAGWHTILVKISPVENETNIANNAESRAIKVYDTDIDFTPIDIYLSDPNPAANQSVRIYAPIKNKGGLPGTTKVMFMVGDTPIGTTAEKTIAGKDNVVEFWVDYVFESEGYHAITAAVDPDNDVAESNEHNNNMTESFYLRRPAPELRITNIRFSNNNPDNETNLTIYVDIINKGELDAIDIQVNLTDNGMPFEPKTVPQLPSGTSTTVSFAHVPSFGYHVYTAYVDAAHTNDETNEDDNMYSRGLNVFEPRPDIRIYSEDISFSNDNPEVDETITIFVDVTNDGKGDSGSFTVRVSEEFEYYSFEIESVTINTLGEQQTKTINVSYTPAVPGPHVIKAKGDSSNVIEESNEQNNDATRAIIAGGFPDLAAISYTLSEPYPAIGEEFNISITVKNLGQDASDSATLLFYADGSLFANEAIGPLASNEEAVITTSFAPTQGSHTITAAVRDVEPEDFVPENNNIIFNIAADVYPPEITLTSPIADKRYKAASITLDFTTDKRAVCEYNLNGFGITSLGSGTAFTTAFTPRHGANAVTISCAKGSLTSSVLVLFRHDTVAPSISINGVANQTYNYPPTYFETFLDEIASEYVYDFNNAGNITLAKNIPDTSAMLESIQKAADRLISTQNYDGTWDWYVDDNLGNTGPTNVQHHPGMGLLYAWELLGNQTYLDAAIKNANWNAQKMFETYRGHPLYPDLNGGDYIFFLELTRVTGNNTYYNWLLEDWAWRKQDSSAGTLFGDGKQADLINLFLSYPSLGPGYGLWECGRWTRAAAMLGDINWSTKMVEELTTDGESPDIVEDLDNSMNYYLIGAAEGMMGIRQNDEANDEWRKLYQLLIDNIDSYGTWGPAWVEDTTYAMMALSEISDTSIDAAIPVMIGWQQENGGWSWDPLNLYGYTDENNEATGEAIEAMYWAMKYWDGTRFNAAIAPQEGSNHLKVSVMDTADPNQNVTEIYFYVDSIPPDVQLRFTAVPEGDCIGELLFNSVEVKDGSIIAGNGDMVYAEGCLVLENLVTDSLPGSGIASSITEIYSSGGRLLETVAPSAAVDFDALEGILYDTETMHLTAEETATDNSGNSRTITLTISLDEDDDGIQNKNDKCRDTVIPEDVPTKKLLPRHYAQTDEDRIFETVRKPKEGIVDSEYSIEDTYGCSCEQILECRPGANGGEYKSGCSGGTMEVWTKQIGWSKSCL